MLALLVKPTLWKSRKTNSVLEGLQTSGAVVLQGSNPVELSIELAALQVLHPDLTLVACGGDGTFHLALNSLPDLRIPIALLPMGTGNDLARYLGIKKPKMGIAALRAGAPVKMDAAAMRWTVRPIWTNRQSPRYHVEDGRMGPAAPRARRGLP